MALITLKNVIFGRKFSSVDACTDKRREPDVAISHQERRASQSSSRTATADNVDLESQTSAQEPRSSPRKGFRVDARVISDATIGLSDGLTVPFALTAGLSALGNTRVVIFGGLAELIAGAISMGLGGYLGAKSEL
jgi:vacuolar iron transporter family protein